MSIFQQGRFISHAGIALDWKIECDALDDGDWQTLGAIVGAQFRYRHVIGVPRGGLRLAEFAAQFATHDPADPVLIVDDVLTTGTSMEETRMKLASQERDKAIGVVVFSRHSAPPDWIKPIFTMWVD